MSWGYSIHPSSRVGPRPNFGRSDGTWWLKIFWRFVRQSDMHDFVSTTMVISSFCTLQTGIFLPLRQFSGAKLSVLATFVISGLYHEYVWMCTFYNQKHLKESSCEGCHEFKFWRVTGFFFYTGIVLLLQRPLGKLAPFQWISNNLPRPVLAHLLLLLHLPVASW